MFWLSGWDGDGTRERPFVPSAAHGATDWVALDLRADVTSADGYALVWADASDGGVWLADAPDEVLGAQARASLRDLANDVPEGATLRDAVRGIVGSYPVRLGPLVEG